MASLIPVPKRKDNLVWYVTRTVSITLFLSELNEERKNINMRKMNKKRDTPILRRGKEKKENNKKPTKMGFY